jgi:ABC-type lipoprotein release transport system permease subunit
MSMPAAQRARSSSTLIVIALFAIGVVAAVVVLIAYGGGSFLPGLIAGFLGTLLAFVLALMWERERERQELEQAAEELNEQRKTEVRRRFESVRAELKKNAESLRLLAEGFERKKNAKPLPQAWWPRTVSGLSILSSSRERGWQAHHGFPN